MAFKLGDEEGFRWVGAYEISADDLLDGKEGKPQFSEESPFSPTVELEQSEKRKTTLSQMRLGSVFKMRVSILNTATTEQMGQGSFSFFVYTKSTDQHFLPVDLRTINCGSYSSLII